MSVETEVRACFRRAWFARMRGLGVFRWAVRTRLEVFRQRRDMIRSASYKDGRDAVWSGSGRWVWVRVETGRGWGARTVPVGLQWNHPFQTL